MWKPKPQSPKAKLKHWCGLQSKSARNTAPVLEFENAFGNDLVEMVTYAYYGCTNGKGRLGGLTGETCTTN